MTSNGYEYIFSFYQIFIEADLDEDNQLSFAEFEHVISKAPDFVEYVQNITFFLFLHQDMI